MKEHDSATAFCARNIVRLDFSNHISHQHHQDMDKNKHARKCLGNGKSFAGIAGGELPAGRRSNVALTRDSLAPILSNQSIYSELWSCTRGGRAEREHRRTSCQSSSTHARSTNHGLGESATARDSLGP